MATGPVRGILHPHGPRARPRAGREIIQIDRATIPATGLATIPEIVPATVPVTRRATVLAIESELRVEIVAKTRQGIAPEWDVLLPGAP